jgi:aminopeptidase N
MPLDPQSLVRRVTLAVLLLLAVVSSTVAAERGTGPFTREPRSIRSRDFDQQHVRLDLHFNFADQEVAGRALHRLHLLRRSPSLELDAAGMEIKQVHLATAQQEIEPRFEPAKFHHADDKLRIELPPEIPLENVLVQIDYHLRRPKRGVHFVKPDPNEPGSLEMAWTQSEPEFARYWYPCFDHPSDRLTSEIVATAPREYFVLSNGVLKEQRDAGEGMQTWHWVQTQSHVPYLLSVVVGDFEALEQQWDGIPVISYVPRGRLEQAKICFDKTPDMVKYFSQRIGYRYPWPKYAQICVDEYMWGGMEHTSATTLNLNTLHDSRAHLDEAAGTDNLVAHELAHQWWGNLVTCNDWAELWLNESFATYFASLWTEHDLGWDEAVWQRRGDAESYFSEDNRYRRSIVNYRYDRPEAMFDSHTYPKGARVLHMLRFELGDELFWKGLRHYVAINQHRTVETADLRRALEEATGQGLGWFFDQWLYHGGHPEFHVEWSYNEKTRQVSVNVRQAQKVDSLTPLFRTHVEIEIGTPEESRIERVLLSKADETFHFPSPVRPSRVVFDPRDWLLDRLTQPKSRSELLDQLANDPHVFARYEAVQGLEKEKDEEAVIAALKQAASSDKFWPVRVEAVKILSQSSGDDLRRLLIDLALDDPKSHVRRQAVIGLQHFVHDETSRALREVIASEPSYKTVAEALRSLVKVDGEEARPDLLAALNQPSHREEIFKAAAAGLNELRDVDAVARLQHMLAERLTADHRAAVIEALAQARSDDPATLELLKGQLEHRRPVIRRQTVGVLADLGKPEAIEWLQQRRNAEDSPRMVRSIDEAIVKLRGRDKPNESLRREIDELRERNRQLEERLNRLEESD